VEARCIGKPSKEFFMAALASMNMDPQNVWNHSTLSNNMSSCVFRALTRSYSRQSERTINPLKLSPKVFLREETGLTFKICLR